MCAGLRPHRVQRGCEAAGVPSEQAEALCEDYPLPPKAWVWSNNSFEVVASAAVWRFQLLLLHTQ